MEGRSKTDLVRQKSQDELVSKQTLREREGIMSLTEVQKMSVCVEEEEDGAESPGSICLSMKSDCSKGKPPVFSNEPGPSDTK
ncbi:NACHT, LRR and PYD domains-containing protein 12-like protein [Lates japonicus]|uniref:NACHT, LRR and PYD domains-containing protein 12-like protein n=1 Tax=Lates japonicus TaxID=270547 RepID=A0AAD3NBR7_LATJO|nr:NACHT, LRR and PYD domains-containing protein 12-like protein [Lates japonicus]